LDWWLVLLIIFGSLIALMVTGLPIALSFFTINIVYMFLFWGGSAGLRQFTLTLWGSVSSFVFMPIPMFIILGEVMFRSGMAIRAMDIIDRWLGRLPGRLALLAVAVSTLFATMSGATVATACMLAETLGRDMEKRGYKKPLIIGSIMGSGGLGMIIPPSAASVFWASIAEVSIGKVLIGGLIPGLIIAIFYATYIIGRCLLQPSIAPAYDPTPVPLSEKLIGTVKYVLPLALIVFMITGLILMGIATPSESAVMGVISCLILAAGYRKLNFNILKESFTSALKITVFIFMVIAGAKAFGQVLAGSGAGKGLVVWVMSLPLSPILVIISMLLIVLFLGMFMHGAAITLITVPLFLPIIYSLGYDPIWFGIMYLVLDEMSQTTPPFGILLYGMKGVLPPDTTMTDIIKAGIPFLICDAMCVVIMLAFPIVALWLPNRII